MRTTTCLIGLVVGVFLVVASSAATAAQTREPLYFRGICDASAAEALTNDLVAIADDEDNAIRVYSLQGGGAPILAQDLSQFLLVDPKSPEVDLEGAARMGDCIYWISSHGRNLKGKARPNRGQFFATRVTMSDGKIDLKPLGQAYHSLLPDLLGEPRLARFGLWKASQLAPKQFGALNIEGLAATTDGQLIIGFRNPVPQGRALLVPLLNPSALTRLEPARFGEPILLDLHGLGVRSITWFRDRFLILAGRFDEGGKSRLFEWKGGAEPPRLLKRVDFHGFNPEAMTVVAAEQKPPQLFVTSDDGSRLVDGQPCKSLQDPNGKTFRALLLPIWGEPEKESPKRSSD